MSIAAVDVVTFADLGVPSNLVESLSRRGITAPFPIQAASLPDALSGRDICGRAPTGSGKTIAFGIPLVLGVGKAKPRRPRGLVLVPTRELAAQVCHELQLLAKPRGPWVESFYGGVGFDRQVKALQRGVDIVVACPGRLADLVNQGCADLRDVDFVVVDEADRMADMGFLPEVRRLLDQCAKQRQTLLFSATLDGDVDVLIKRYQRDPVRHELFEDKDSSMAEHLFWNVERSDRVRVTAAIIDRVGATIVFCRTKRGADRIARQLEQWGITAAAIHGDRSQSQRDRALLSFHQGRVDTLVATDVAARGIHVDGIACVVHFDPPGDSKDYVHRSGRTARAGEVGFVISLVPGDLRRDVGKLQKDLGHPVGLSEGRPGDLAPSRDAKRRSGSGRNAKAKRPSDVATVSDIARPAKRKPAHSKPTRSGSSRGRSTDHRAKGQKQGRRAGKPA